eukprot:g31805.t1
MRIRVWEELVKSSPIFFFGCTGHGKSRLINSLLQSLGSSARCEEGDGGRCTRRVQGYEVFVESWSMHGFRERVLLFDTPGWQLGSEAQAAPELLQQCLGEAERSLGPSQAVDSIFRELVGGLVRAAAARCTQQPVLVPVLTKKIKAVAVQAFSILGVFLEAVGVTMNGHGAHRGTAPETLAELGTPGRLSPRFGAALIVARGPPPRGAGQRLGLRELRREGVGRGREHAQEVEAGGSCGRLARGLRGLAHGPTPQHVRRERREPRLQHLQQLHGRGRRRPNPPDEWLQRIPVAEREVLKRYLGLDLATAALLLRTSGARGNGSQPEVDSWLSVSGVVLKTDI